MKKNKNLNYYINLPWTYTITEDQDKEGIKIYVISSNELPGIQSDGYTLEEAHSNIKEAMEAALELYLEMGDPIPVPKKAAQLKSKYKGNITYRTSEEKHKLLAQEAKRRKKPINKLIDEYVSIGLRAKTKDK